MNKISNILKTEKLLIGALHFPPLLGYPEFTSMEKILDFSLQNAKTLEQASFDAIIVENNYDVPHQIKIGPETVAAMTYLTDQIAQAVSIPIGVSVLWNSFEAALSIAKVTGAQFIRVPVFVDQVETSYGRVYGEPEKTTAFRQKVGAENVLLFTDIQVKHSKLLNVRPIGEAAVEAKQKGADVVIVTGKWTGDAPVLDDLRETRQAIGEHFPIIIGSGATVENVGRLLQYANGVIVGTALKAGPIKSKEKEINLVRYDVPINLEKSQQFAKAFKQAAENQI